VAGSAGETTQNLLWRITQLEGFNHTAPWVCVLNIGQADLEGGATVRLSDGPRQTWNPTCLL